MAATMKPSKTAPSILSQDIHIIGQIISSGDVQIEGRLDGDLRSHAVTIGEHAETTGEIAGDTVTVRGKITGTIRASTVHLCATCHVEGDIYHEALAIETGAHLNGVVKHEKDPMNNATITLLHAEGITGGSPDKKATIAS